MAESCTICISRSSPETFEYALVQKLNEITLNLGPLPWWSEHEWRLGLIDLEVFTVVKVKFVFFWAVTPCGVVVR
jgi:hypothetical protein